MLELRTNTVLGPERPHLEQGGFAGAHPSRSRLLFSRVSDTSGDRALARPAELACAQDSGRRRGKAKTELMRDLQVWSGGGLPRRDRRGGRVAAAIPAK